MQKEVTNEGEPPCLTISDVQLDDNVNPIPDLVAVDITPPPEIMSEKYKWQDFRWLEVFNTIIAIGTLIIAFAAYRVASDTADIKIAVGDLGRLAHQTERQAKALEDQLGQVKLQTNSLGLQVARKCRDKPRLPKSLQAIAQLR